MKRLQPLPLLTIAFFILTAGSCFAHTINYSMEIKPIDTVIGFYTWLGFLHIIPHGLDHILFVLSLFLLDSRLKPVILQASCFTVAHTVTLILSSKGIIEPPEKAIEIIISASIVFVALENIFIGTLKPWRYFIIFVFGLIHGMGFATALNETGLPRNAFYTSLISFNVGVELGQIAVIMIAYFLVGKWFSHEVWYKKRIVYPASALIALIACYWTFERIFTA
ncbi:MAG: HupE/UreJ family protein [Bacteroidota bacterium]|nr:HupE/UreJ family protein [Bacteroidota bacterium]